MQSIRDSAARFLANRRIAVTGGSHASKGHGANMVCQRLRTRRYEVFALNPNSNEVEDDVCYGNMPGSCLLQ